MADSSEFEQIKESLKKAASALQRAEVPFLLGGGLAGWARGGPESSHDLDVLVKPAEPSAPSTPSPRRACARNIPRRTGW